MPTLGLLWARNPRYCSTSALARMATKPRTQTPPPAVNGDETATDLPVTAGNPSDTSPLAMTQSASHHLDPKFHEEFDASQRGSSIVDGDIAAPGLNRNASMATTSNQTTSMPSRGGTLKKKGSLSRRTSLKRSGSRRTSRAGSVRSLGLGDREKYGVGDVNNSAFFTPVPTGGSPTEVLANRFQGTCAFDARNKTYVNTNARKHGERY